MLHDDTYYCGECGEECEPLAKDFSFDHAFGTHVDRRIVSDCCWATIVDGAGRPVPEKELTEED